VHKYTADSGAARYHFSISCQVFSPLLDKHPLTRRRFPRAGFFLPPSGEISSADKGLRTPSLRSAASTRSRA